MKTVTVDNISKNLEQKKKMCIGIYQLQFLWNFHWLYWWESFEVQSEQMWSPLPGKEEHLVTAQDGEQLRWRDLRVFVDRKRNKLDWKHSFKIDSLAISGPLKV